jgi:glyoxylase-like metal-dependent hydrolase (beta-lactamase superfamily II)
MTGETLVERLHVLLCGYEIIPRSISLRGADPLFLHAVPITCYLIGTRAGWVLFDTALDPARLADRDLCAAFFTDHGWDPPPAVLPAHRMEPQLAALGLGLGDIETVVLSHLHADHTGYLKHLSPGRVVLQKAEQAHGFGGAADAAFFHADYNLPGLPWDIVEGDAEVMPGIRALFTPGHTPGHQSLLLDMPDGPPVLLAGDVGDLRENFDGGILPGSATDDDAARASLARVSRLERELGARLLITHDPDQIRTIPLAPAPYG